MAGTYVSTQEEDVRNTCDIRAEAYRDDACAREGGPREPLAGLNAVEEYVGHVDRKGNGHQSLVDGEVREGEVGAGEREC